MTLLKEIRSCHNAKNVLAELGTKPSEIRFSQKFAAIAKYVPRCLCQIAH